MTVVEMFRDDIAAALASDVAITLETTHRTDGTEPIVTLLIDGTAVFYFRRDEVLEALYGLGCDVIGELERAGLPTVRP